uniref:Protein kinase domain-containing protein n=1 Tax=Scylla olivacea TaxID=85551 RepID=A0A0P4VSW4_SCYOL
MIPSQDSSCKEEEVRQELQRLGVPLRTREEMEAMQRVACVALGAGKYGSCVRSVDPATQQAVVIKTFKGHDLNSLLVEARNLQRFQIPGVQRLVGVCVETSQLLTCYAGYTVEEYFLRHVPYSQAVTVFLQLARTVQAILARGYTHNDLKKDNMCVRDTSGGPVATIIDLGIATPVGTRRVFPTKTHPEDFPWVPPELLANTHPTSEASDAYRFANAVKEALRLREGAPHPPTVHALMHWLEAALRPDPTQRPPLAALVRVLEALQEATYSVSPPRLPPHGPGWRGE